MQRALTIVLLTLGASGVFAQDLATPIPIGPDGRPVDATAPAPMTAAPRAAGPASPPTLPANPRVRAGEAVASGQGGLSYCGPAGAMSTAPSGAMCSASCPGGEAQVSCPAGSSAVCQCETQPYASCRPQ